MKPSSKEMEKRFEKKKPNRHAQAKKKE